MIQSHLGTLESSGLVRVAQLDPELEYLFRHALVQDAAYDSLLRQDRRRLHLAVAEVLEGLYADRLDELAGTLAQHFDAAEDPRAFAYYLRAADVAASQYANAIAIDLYRRVLEKARALPIEESLLLRLCRTQGRLLELVIQHEEALQHYEEMASWGAAIGSTALRLLALTEQAKIYATVASHADVERGQRLADEALTLARQVGHHEMESKALWCMMWVQLYSDQPRQALQYGEQSLAIARRFDLRERLAYALNDLYHLYADFEGVQKATQALEEAQALWRELGNLPMLTDNLTRSGMRHYGVGDYEQAHRYLEEANQISRATGNLWSQIDSQWMLGYIYLAQGQVGRSLATIEETFAPSQAAGLFFWQAIAHSSQAWVYSTIGAYEPALLQSELARQAVERLPEIAREIHLYSFIRAYVRAASGDLEGAEADIRIGEQELERLSQDERPPTFPLLVLARSKVALARGADAEVIAEVDALFTERTLMGNRTPTHLTALHLKGQALLAQSRWNDAREVLEEAMQRARGMPYLLAQLLSTMSQLEARTGHPAQALVYQSEAGAQVDLVLAQLSPELGAAFLRLPSIQAIWPIPS